MSEDGAAVQVVDAAAHPSFGRPDELRDYMPEPWRSRAFPIPDRYYYPVPGNEWREDAAVDGAAAGSDPALFRRQLLDEAGVDIAILLPLTRGLLPDLDLSAAICAATNEWLATTWLGTHNEHGRFRGSIRIDPRDPAQAVKEIERWAGHPHMVQVAVTLQAQQPYGQRCYLPVWEATAHHGLPVAVHADGGAGIEFWPTGVGFCSHYVEFATLFPLSFAVHLFSLIAEGVFERFDRLSFVFADGGLDALAPLIWRFDKDWRPSRYEVPWVERMPSEYLHDHVRFCSQAYEGPEGEAEVSRWIEVSEAAELQLYSSNYPYREYPGSSDRVRRRRGLALADPRRQRSRTLRPSFVVCEPGLGQARRNGGRG